MALFLLWVPRTKYSWGSQLEAERRRENEREKSSVRWPHSDNKPAKSLSLEPFRNSTFVYTGGGWTERDMQGVCILQHLIMATKHKQPIKSHTHANMSVLSPRFLSDVTFVGEWDTFVDFVRSIPLCLNFKVKFLYTIQVLSNTTILGYRPVSTRLLERRPLVGSCDWLQGCLLQQHPLGQSSTHVEGYNSPKVAAQTIVYATAR